MFWFTVGFLNQITESEWRVPYAEASNGDGGWGGEWGWWGCSTTLSDEEDMGNKV